MRLSPLNRPIESLEHRRVLSAVTLDIDGDASPFTASASLNGSSLTPDGPVTGSLDGTVDLSSTKAGIKFLSGDINVLDSNGAPVTVSFSTALPGQTVDVVNPSFAFSSTRIDVGNNKFSTRRLTAAFDAGTVNLTGLPGAATLNGLSGEVNYAVARVRRTSGSIRVTVPYDFDVSATVTQGGIPQTLQVTVSGTLSAVGLFGSAPASLPVAPAATASSKTRVADEVLG
jgi:hypothetical protein